MSGQRAMSLPERAGAQLRASDAERERAAATLREHAAAGRLTMEELDARAQAAFAARTRGDLQALLSDLPEQLPARAGSRRLSAKKRAHAAHVRAYILVCLGLIALWAATGAGYFWPLWPAIGWGIGVASHTAGWRRACMRTTHTTSS